MIMIAIKMVNTVKSDNTSSMNPITAKATTIAIIMNPVTYFTNFGK